LKAWKRHLSYNPGSIATYYNIANTYTYLVKDDEQAKKYYQQFLDLAELESPSQKLNTMIDQARAALKTIELRKDIRNK